MIRRSPVVVVGKYHCSTIATVKAAEKFVFCLRKWYWDTYRRSPPPSKTKPSRLSHPLTSKSALVFIHTLIHSYIQTFCIIHTYNTYIQVYGQQRLIQVCLHLRSRSAVHSVHVHLPSQEWRHYSRDSSQPNLQSLQWDRFIQGI